MTDFHERFRSLDRVQAPDLWDEVTRRAEQSISTESVRRVSVGRATPVGREPLRIAWSVTFIVLGAMLLAGLVGGLFIAGALNARPSPTVAHPSPAPTSSPVPFGEVPGSLGIDVTSPGRYWLAWDDLDAAEPIQQVIATVPGGWHLIESARGGGVAKEFDGLTALLTYGHDARLGCGETPFPGQTVDDLTASLGSFPGMTVTDLVIDGYTGKRVELIVPTDGAPCGYPSSWSPGWHQQLSIVDINGSRFVIDAAYAPNATASDQAQLQEIVDSIQLQ